MWSRLCCRRCARGVKTSHCWRAISCGATAKKNKRLVRVISPEALAYLQGYEWPGNVRQLENAIEYAVVFGSTDQILPEDLPDNILENTVAAGAPQIQYKDAIKEAKKQIVLNALRQSNNNFTEA